MPVCPHCVLAGLVVITASVPAIKFVVLPKLRLGKKQGLKETPHAQG